MDFGQGKNWNSLVENNDVPEVHRYFMIAMQNSHDQLAQEVENIDAQDIADWFKTVAETEEELEWYFDTDDDGTVTGGGYY
jgi:diadenosine tetraphosphate (Ap4A) HIT family hydrolase